MEDINELLGRSKISKTASFIKVDVTFITKPFEIASYFNDYYLGKVRAMYKIITD